MEGSRQHLASICVSPTDTFAEVLKKLAAHKPRLTGLPGGIVAVTEKAGKLCGIVTSGDVTRALAAEVPLDTPVAKVMNTAPFTVLAEMTPTEIVTAVQEKLREEGWHRDRLDKVIVVDKQGRLVNLADLYDLWRGSDTLFKRVGILGLGYVGLTLGLTFADLGFKVHAVDKNPALTRMVKSRRAPFFEEGLDRLLKDHVGSTFHIVPTFEGRHSAEAYFIAVGTPLGADQIPNLAYITDAAEHVGSVLKKGDLVVLRSTVPLGTTRNVVVPILEKQSGLTAGEDFFVAFAPERTIEGRALEELRKLPQVIGGINRASSNEAASLFNTMTETVLIVDSLEEAEVVKLINNTYRDVTFAFANEVALVCQRWGIDTNKVIHAANMGYERSRVPKPSPGVGGYCLVKDPFIFVQGAQQKGYEPVLFKEARNVNVRILETVAEDVVRFLKGRKKKKNAKVFIMGFAFKGRPATSDLRGSSTLVLVERLRQAGFTNIYGYDPVVPMADMKKLPIKPVKKLSEGFKGADAIVVMNNHEDFENLNMRSYLRNAASEPLLYDTWALYSREDVEKFPGVVYRRL